MYSFNFDYVEAIRIEQNTTKDKLVEFFKDYPDDTVRVTSWLDNPNIISLAIKTSETNYLPVEYGKVIVKLKHSSPNTEKTYRDFIVMDLTAFVAMFKSANK